MHPSGAFHDVADEEALALAERIAFAHIVAVQDGRPAVAHAPVVRAGQRSFRFHLARGNRLTAQLDDAPVLLSFVGANGYVTPNWYDPPGDQVPTWNYLAVEIDGMARLLPDESLVDQLDRLAELHEPGLSPVPWTRSKMDPTKFDAMRKAVRGFNVSVDAVRVTRKLGQNKPIADRLGVIAGLERAGNADLAAWSRQTL